LRVPEENLYIRYEDVIVVTENGMENFTSFLPSELGEMERLVGTGGILQQFPPAPVGAMQSIVKSATTR
jgi:Xaa-Pro aminopeptidase